MARALIRAQMLSIFRYYARGGRTGAVIAGLATAAWYALVLAGAVGVGLLCARGGPRLLSAMSAGCLFLVVYWQFLPLVLVSAGAGLDLKRLVVYPLTARQLFGMDLLLRITTGVEALLVITGASIGLMFNTRVRWWALVAFVPFIVFNLGMASGLRAVVGRWMTARRTRELTMLGLVLIATLPQLLLSTRMGGRFNRSWAQIPGMPWTLTADWALSGATVAGALALMAWAAAAVWFGWWQFQKSLRFDSVAAQARRLGGARDRLGWLPGLLAPLGDPLAALVEKELRSLSRTPRFRVVFIMGFTFSLMIWLPLMATRNGTSAVPSNFLALMTGYSLLLLGESCFWNTLGFDRAAAQMYFLAPVRFTDVMKAKNIATSIIVAAELACLTAVALLLRLPLSVRLVAEAAAVGAVLSVLLLAAGNFSSVYAPRAADPADIWRKSSAGKTQAMGAFLAPLLALPVSLAYLARYAFSSEWAFWGTMGTVAAIAAIAYSIALDSAARAAMERKEAITAVLSAGGSPVNG